jgi:hypothetical protein
MTELVFVLLKVAEIGAVVVAPWLVYQLLYWALNESANDGILMGWFLGLAVIIVTVGGMLLLWGAFKALPHYIALNMEWAQRLTQ